MAKAAWLVRVEWACVALFFAWLFWIPLPFGSVVAGARLPLLAVPFVLCLVAAALRLMATTERNSTPQPTLAWILWSLTLLAVLVIGLMQLVPLPPPLLRWISPESWRIWEMGAGIASMAGADAPSFWPLSIAPRDTLLEILRIASLGAVFMTAAMLLRNHDRRRALAAALIAAATFEAIYGLREAALQRYAIWGWVNRLIYDRVTGTFVNPNHFAHHAAIILPMALFIVAIEWHYAAGPRAPLPYRVASLMERGPLTIGLALFGSVVCVGAILLAQSRGALLAVISGVLAVSAMMPGKRIARAALSAAAALAIFAAAVLFLGSDRTVQRFVPTSAEVETMVGRRIGIGAGLRVWQRFPLFGSGLGTFERVVLMEQDRNLDRIYHHAHNDYVEIAATGGATIAVVAIAGLLAGYLALVRLTFGKRREELTWKRRAFQAAALLSLTIAMVHALYDFNFFIPANPATLAAILGAAVSALDHDKRSRL